MKLLLGLVLGAVLTIGVAAIWDAWEQGRDDPYERRPQPRPAA